MIDAVESENRRIPVGSVEYNETERIVQVKGELHEIEDFRQMVVAHRKTSLALVLLFLALAAAIPALGLVGSEFLPKTDQSRLSLEIRTPGATTLEFTAKKARQVDAALREFPAIAEAYTTINNGDSPGKNIITTSLQLVDKANRAGEETLIPKIRTRLEPYPSTQLKILPAKPELS